MSTTRAWARQIKKIEDITEAFKSVPAPDGTGFEGAVYIVYCPSDQWGPRKTQATLGVVWHNGVSIYTENAEKHTVQSAHHFKDDLIYLQKRAALLHSWIEICTLVVGVAVVSRVEFNTVVKEIFNPILDVFRDFNRIKRTVERNPNDEIQALYEELDIRFRNYIWFCGVLPHRIDQMIYQPGIKIPFLKYFRKALTFPHLFIRTPEEWIIISEGEAKPKSSPTYEDIFTFIPLGKIKMQYMELREDGNLNLITDLGSGCVLRFIIASANGRYFKAKERDEERIQ